MFASGKMAVVEGEEDENRNGSGSEWKNKDECKGER